MNFNATNSVLPARQANLCVYDRLATLFVNTWSTNINYSQYVAQCAPSFCTYSFKEQSNISYTITLLISLYGGLTLILRSLAAYLVKTVWKVKHSLTNTSPDSGTSLITANEISFFT